MKKILTLLFLVVGLSATAQTFDFTCAQADPPPTLENFVFSSSFTHNAFTLPLNTGTSFTLFDYDTYTGYAQQTWADRTDDDDLDYLDGRYFVAVGTMPSGAGVAVAIYHARAASCCQLTLTLIEGSSSARASLYLLE